MKIWLAYYRRGCRKLAKHDPRTAAAEFQEALKSCPVSEHAATARILYYLGLSLERAGRKSLAVQSWISARKLERRGAIAKAYERWVNEYGMHRCASAEADDFQAFRSIQVARYLGKRYSGRFGSPAERDVVYEVISDAWGMLKRSGILLPMSTAEKLDVYRRARLDFPYLFVEDALEEDCVPIAGNFRRAALGKVRIGADDRCSCGSGLPSRMCCGRTRSCVEVEAGSH